MTQPLDHSQLVENTAHNILEDYFNRIGYFGDKEPTIETLSKIQLLHTQFIPFENLNPLLNYPVNLDMDSIRQKLLRNGRGGYCFEQNGLFAHVLQLLGFSVKRLSARVLWNVPEGVIPPRGHKLLFVNIENDGPYITDVGFGGLSLTGPLKWKLDVEQQTPHEPFRIIKSEDEYILQAKVQEQWRALYQFSLMGHLPQDYEASNWYLSNHPKSHFTYSLIAAKAVPGKRYNLSNNEFSIHHLNGSSEKKTLKDATEIKNILKDVFNINLEGLKGLDEKLEELVKV